MQRLSQRTFALGVLLAAATTLAYLPALRAGFIWDDGSFLTDNPMIKAADGLRRYWFTTEAPDYWPVTSTTLWGEWRLWGMHAAGYHATNLALHIGESLLLWAVLRRLAIPGAFFAALLFAVHPVNVESVAWITQRKNLMAMLFYLASIYWFDSRAYWLSLIAFTLAMLSKASVAILPVVLLGIILWRRRPTARDGLRLAPFFLVAAALVAVNLWFQGRHLPGAIRTAGPVDRVLGAGAVIWFYLWKAIVPIKLMFFYPEWHIHAGDPRWWAPLAGSLGVTALLWWRARRLLFGWGYFCLALLPVMGFADITFMQFSLVADHYQHLALIAVVALVGAAWARWAEGAGENRLEPGHRTGRLPMWVAVATVLSLIGLTWSQCLMYRDATTLYLAAIRANPNAWLAENNLGLLYRDQGKTTEATGFFEAALRANPNCVEAHNNLGMLLADAGQDSAAVEHYETALRLRPEYAEAHNNLGNVLRRTGRLSEARAEYQAALRYNKNLAGAHNGLGLTLAAEGQAPESLAEYEQALRCQPDFPQAHHGLGLALVGAGRKQEGMGHLKEAVRLKPDYVEAHYDLGLALAGAGRLSEAISQFRDAVRLEPTFVPAQSDLGVALAKVGSIQEGLSHLQAAAALKPDDAQVRDNLRAVQKLAGAL